MAERKNRSPIGICLYALCSSNWLYKFQNAGDDAPMARSLKTTNNIEIIKVDGLADAFLKSQY